ncbi:AI-2E family transporter [Tabrizicola sp.]|jgi:predicted PurR-regulated permease PerM|uniref:AI-2E family transporter n=1 Tax=Tabrizicola sp. TaxID=2005166 RepID=UPI001A620870|nr:AI-2E family transporter [Tabrizicola sp.]MBL9061046.1 AI-2E family transporter [Tabrizicola sp.]
MPDTDEAATSWRDRTSLPTESGHSIVSLTTLATIVVVCAILYVAKDLFLPLVLGMLLAFILTPVVNALRRRGLRDMPAVLITVVAAGGLVAAFVLIIAYQVSQIGANLPQYQGNVLTKIDTLLEAGRDNQLVAHLQGMVEKISTRLAAETPDAQTDAQTMKVEVVEHSGLKDWLFDVILPALAPIGIFGLIFVVVVFALLERATLRDRLVQLIGGTNILTTSRLLAEAGARVSTYLLAQLVVNVIYAVPIWLGLWLIGVPNALFFGLVTLVMRFVPYIGSAISAILPLLMAFAVSPDWSLVLWTGALFLVVEFVTSNIVEPWFYGQRTGVSPLAVIVSAMFWTWLWGPMGLIIATPLTVCLVVIGHHVPSLRLFPIMFGDQPILADSARLYDRLLAGRSFEFTEAATATTAKRYLADYYDKTAIPALALAEADHEAGLLTDHATHRIANAAWILTEELDTVVEDELALGAEGGEDETDESLVGNGKLDGLGRRIAVIGAQTQLDDVTSQMVAQALRAEGAEVAALPLRAVLPRALRSFKPETLVVVTLGTANSASVDLQVRQLRRRLSGVRIGVAKWSVADAAPTETQRKAVADFVASGMEALFENAFASTAEKPA